MAYFSWVSGNSLQNYIGKLKMLTWNWSDTDCKNEWAISNRLISLTGPFPIYENISICNDYPASGIFSIGGKTLQVGQNSLGKVKIHQVDTSEIEKCVRTSSWDLQFHFYILVYLGLC